MGRKTIVVLLVALALASVHLAEGQQPGKIARIGLVSGSGDPKTSERYVEAFRQGLRDLGYIDGRNILIDFRSMEGTVDSIPSLVAELVRLKIDVLVVQPLVAIRAAKQATKTIPIVIVASFDPIEMGIVDSLARPGGNITGLATLGRELGGKRLELLKEVVPSISRVGLLTDADAPILAIALKEYETVASALKIQLQSLEVRGPNPDLEGAFQAAIKGRINALIAVSNPLLSRYQKQIADLTIKNRTPTMCEVSGYVEAGCLMSYSTNSADQYKRAAVYVDKILKGTKPADLPIEQPTKFEFVINLKTAKQIGLTIPQWTLTKADKVIR
jgi:putative tryptophan/tyrosine transport system substrate-binding protein